MKYLVIVLDGVSEEVTNQSTTLEQAYTPNLDALACLSTIGLVNCIREGYSVASDIANMSILGYRPSLYYTGRAYLEAQAQGIKLQENEIVYRANLVKLSNEKEFFNKTMIDFSSNNINDNNAKILINEINAKLDSDSRLVYGSSYHHLLITKNKSSFDIIPPHEIMNKKIKKYIKTIDDNNYFYKIMHSSEEIIASRFNTTSLWLWSPSKPIIWPSFYEKYQLKGAMITAVSAIKGIGKLADLDCIKVKGATGDNLTNYHNKINKSLDLLDNQYDFVYLHIEACDYCSHQGDQLEKIRSIEAIDKSVISKILKYEKHLRVLILPDHHTSCLSKMHEVGAVPFMLYDNKKINNNSQIKYQEKDFNALHEYNVLTLMELLISNK